jgi:hypothetical protein
MNPTTIIPTEKKPQHLDIGEMTTDREYIVNTQAHKDEDSETSVEDIRMTKDGKIALILQRSDDSRDHLN